MATIVLTVAGGFFGGPIGAAIGAAAGAALDRELLFKPKGREGPRLQELRIQTSSYGAQIPKLFGTMRVSGSVIWATELVEHRSTQRAKGRPNATSYSYTASFAVALSARPILGIGRIWAEGKLLRGAGDDFKSATGFRLHAGNEAQAPDPLIASAEGAGMAPAHQGLAYVVFEDMALADYGNRIPSLTFEVFADAGQIEAGAIVAELAPGVRCEEATPALAGFSAYGGSLRTVVEILAGASGGWFRPEAGELQLSSGADGPAIALSDAGASRSGRCARGRRAITGADAAPARLTLTHYDPARDYQAGVQRAARPSAGTREARIELPAALDASSAKAIAEAALARAELERERRTVTLGWDAIAVVPGARVTIAGASGPWRVARWMLEHMVVTLECVRLAPGAPLSPASGGRVLPAPDLAIGTTILHAFELPPLGDTPASVPQLGIAAAGSAPGWRNAALMLSSDGGGSWSPIGGTAAPAVLGTIVVPPGSAPAVLEDARNVIVVELAHAAMDLSDADHAALAAGANLALAGDELIQFARAEPLAGRHWQLAGLWRGRRGTEAAAGLQLAGDRFVMLDPHTLVTLGVPAGSIGADLRVMAQGVGDEGGAIVPVQPNGISVVPPAPVHLRATLLGGGGTRLDWVRRSRIGWDWIDGVDAPLGEESERYLVTIEGNGEKRAVETPVPELMLDAADQMVPLVVRVRQIGSHGLSPAAELSLPPLGES